MDMGLGPIESFAATWVVMMAAMMLPSAIPVVLEFARTAERRRGWPVATGVLAVTYLGVWLIFGVVCYAIYTAAGMPWPNQTMVAGLALALAGVYSVTPIKRASQARCRELCALHGPLPFNLMRSAAVAGARYGLSCLGCSAALMVAMVLLGMSSLWWAVILGIVVLIYKLAPPLRMRYELALSARSGGSRRGLRPDGLSWAVASAPGGSRGGSVRVWQIMSRWPGPRGAQGYGDRRRKVLVLPALPRPRTMDGAGWCPCSAKRGPTRRDTFSTLKRRDNA